MANKDQMFRLMTLVNFLRQNTLGANFRQISEHVEQRFYQDSLSPLRFSEKTFQRDRKTILEVLGICIVYNRSDKVYQIIEGIENQSQQLVFDSLLLVQAYRQATDQKDIVLYEKRQALGLEHIPQLIQAIKNSNLVRFEYTKHSSKETAKRVVEPYAIKEFRNRWYLLAHEHHQLNFILKTYGLDRIEDLELTASVFVKQPVDLKAYYKHSFGIVSTLGQSPETIYLNFDPSQSSYVNSLPIHHSQRIITQSSTEFQISLNLVPTYDFYQELLTHSERLIGIKPEHVKSHYLNVLQKAITNLK